MALLSVSEAAFLESNIPSSQQRSLIVNPCRDKFCKTAMAGQTALTPSVSWAQRPKIIFLTINVSDIENPEIKVEKDSLFFKGTGGAEKAAFELNMKFLKEVRSLMLRPPPKKHDYSTGGS